MNALGERIALDQLEDEKFRCSRFPQFVNGRYVGVIQGGDGSSFAMESGDPLRVARKLFGQDLDGHVALQLRVAGPVDFAHPAAAEHAGDFVRAKLCADRYRQIRLLLSDLGFVECIRPRL